MRLNNPQSLVRILCIIAVCTPLFSPACRAQAQQTKPYSPLDELRYDAARSGPLLLVPGGAVDTRVYYGDGSLTLDQWAEANGRRIVTVGGITVLPPKTMQVIEPRPGIPDPYVKLKPEERLKVLLSLFSEDQWKQAGSPVGVGPDDLNDNQRLLFIGLLPEKIALQQNKLFAGNAPNSIRYEPQGGQIEEDPAAARLRLNRKVSFGFSKLGSTDSSYLGGVDPMAGDVITTLLSGRDARGDAQQDEPGTVKVFGVPILRMVSSFLKPSQLDHARPDLRVQIPLDQNLKTVGDLLSSVAKATSVDLAADRRLAALPLFRRIAPAQMARAGDILQALCWSVTGTFRRVGASTYLLTDDIQGIGTRFARLGEWAEKPYIERAKALDALNEKTAKNQPLSHVGFAPGDTYSLPAALQQRVDSAFLKGAEEPWVAPADLSAALQQQIEKHLKYWSDNETVYLRSDRVQISTEMTAQFVFPDGAAVEAPFSENIGMQYLHFAAVPPKPAAPAVATAMPAPKPMPASLHKRVLVAQLPQEDKSVADLLTLAKRKGFSEVWLHVMLDDGEAATRLRSALKTARKIGISAGCAVSLLHQGGLRAPEDVNLLGETGENFSKRRLAADPDFKYVYSNYAGWTMLDSAAIDRILESLASVQGLSALALKATAAPGWAAYTPGGDGIEMNGYLGYTVDTRLLCIRDEGFDPVDVSPYLYPLDLDPNLLFFPSGGFDGMWKSLCEFRFRENTQRLGQIHAAIKRVAPSLPLYLDDRGIIHMQSHLCWYARWDKASRIPLNQVFAVESEERAGAFASTDEPIRIRYGDNAKPEALAVRFGNMAQDAAKNWRGVALDLATLAPANALRILAALPTSPSVPF